MSGRNRDRYQRPNMKSFQSHGHFNGGPAHFYPPESEAPFRFGEGPRNRWPSESSRTIVFDEGVRRWPSEAPSAPHQLSNSFRVPERSGHKSPYHWSAAHHRSAQSPTVATQQFTKMPVHKYATKPLSTATGILETYNLFSSGNIQESAHHRPVTPKYSRDLREKLSCHSPPESFKFNTPRVEEQVHSGFLQSSMPSKHFVGGTSIQSSRPAQQSTEETEYWRDDWQDESFSAPAHAENIHHAYHRWSSNPFIGPEHSKAKSGTFPPLVPPKFPEDTFIQAPSKAKTPRIRKKKLLKLQEGGLLKKKSKLPQRRNTRPISIARLGRRKARLAKNLRRAENMVYDEEKSDKRRANALNRIPVLMAKINSTMAQKKEMKMNNKRRKEVAREAAAREAAAREAAAREAAAIEAAAIEAAEREAKDSIRSLIKIEIKSEPQE